jgi:type IV pilus assembly protein PilC
MVAVGEATGQLEQMFERISNFYRREADAVTSGLVDLLQPVLLVVIAVMVGFLFTSILLPLYQLTASIQ